MGIKDLVGTAREKLNDIRAEHERERMIKGMTRQQLNEMIEGVRESIVKVSSLDGVAERESALEGLKFQIEEVESVIDDCIEYAQTEMSRLAKSQYEVASRDLVQLQRQERFLQSKKEEISIIKCEIFGGTPYKAEEPEVIFE